VKLEFTEHEDRVYQDAPLRSVLAQVRFDPIPALLAEAGTAGFHSVIHAKYPNGPERATDVDIRVTQSAVGVRTAAPVWKFRTIDEQFSVSLSHDFLALETPRYTHFDDFLDQFAFALKAIERTLMPSSSRRVGLRKINAIPLPEPQNPATLSSRVRPELLGGIAYSEFPTKLRGAEGALVFEDNLNLLFVRYGLEGDAESEANFVLDMDYATETPQAVSADGAILELLAHFSAGITSFFEWALTEDYKMSLRPQPRGAS
jgi:uncharacterized protein (TIGR04255 family)